MVEKPKFKVWQEKAINIYQDLVCDMSFDHISVETGYSDKNSKPYHIQELGYDVCPKCKKTAPIINFNFHEPKTLILMCDCGYESKVNKPSLVKAYLRIQ